MTYQFVEKVAGNLASILTDSIEDAIANLGLIPNGIETRACLRDCLKGQPRFKGFAGPCYGGEENGVTIIRYESAAAFAELSF